MEKTLLTLEMARRIELAEAQAAVSCAETMRELRGATGERGGTRVRRICDLLRRE